MRIALATSVLFLWVIAGALSISLSLLTLCLPNFLIRVTDLYIRPAAINLTVIPRLVVPKNVAMA